MTGMGRTGKAVCGGTLGCGAGHDSGGQGHRQRLRAAGCGDRGRPVVDDFARVRHFSARIHVQRASGVRGGGSGGAGLHRTGIIYLTRVEPPGANCASARAAAKFSVVGDIRGMGLLQGIEFVRDAKTREPFPPDARISNRIAGGRDGSGRGDVSDARHRWTGSAAIIFCWRLLSRYRREQCRCRGHACKCARRAGKCHRSDAGESRRNSTRRETIGEEKLLCAKVESGALLAVIAGAPARCCGTCCVRCVCDYGLRGQNRAARISHPKGPREKSRGNSSVR